jgi:putative ABC transport system permease protein
MFMVAFTIALGASLASAMLTVMFDVGDKVNQELKTYGANITVMPQGAFLLSGLYGVNEGAGVSDKFLREDEIGRIKTIFWAFNILDFAPYLNARHVRAGSGDGGVPVTGTWFARELDLPTGEAVTTGIRSLKTWWTVEGAWAKDPPPGPSTVTPYEAMAGREAARRLGLGVGDSFTLTGADGQLRHFALAGIFHSGGDEDRTVYIPLGAAQELEAREGLFHRLEVSALTTPDNDLARRAAVDPNSLSIKDWETWYCTAYVSAICYQIDEVISGAVSKPVRQVSQSEGAILEKTELLMLLITALSLAGSALGISNLVTASVMERSAEIALLKAVGATDSAVTSLVLGEILLAALSGGAAGYFLGLGFARVIGMTVFSSAVSIKPQVIPLTAALVLLVTLAGSVPAIRLLLRLRPAEVLHGR